LCGSLLFEKCVQRVDFGEKKESRGGRSRTKEGIYEVKAKAPDIQ